MPDTLGHRALAIARQALALSGERLHHETVRAPVGMAFWLTARFAGGPEVVTTFGDRRIEPEAMARAPPAPLAGGSFRTGPAGLHTTTNAAVIERFLPVRFEIVTTAEFPRESVDLRVRPSSSPLTAGSAPSTPAG